MLLKGESTKIYVVDYFLKVAFYMIIVIKVYLTWNFSKYHLFEKHVQTTHLNFSKTMRLNTIRRHVFQKENQIDVYLNTKEVEKNKAKAKRRIRRETFKFHESVKLDKIKNDKLRCIRIYESIH